MIRARTLNEYIDWVKQATFDAEELRASIEYDEEFMGDALVIFRSSRKWDKKTI
ncbi:MAG: hypothetical protein O6852_08050 [Gammaproteobacteria bacterium]|nr:hypothetical protein [Gammaproteobacteria bacterium]